MKPVRTTFCVMALLMALITGPSLAGDDCLQRLDGRWEFEPTTPEQTQLLADMGVIEMLFEAEATRWTVTIGKEVEVHDLVVVECNGDQVTLAKIGEEVKLIITFLSEDRISVASTDPDGANTYQIYVRKR